MLENFENYSILELYRYNFRISKSLNKQIEHVNGLVYSGYLGTKRKSASVPGKHLRLIETLTELNKSSTTCNIPDVYYKIC